MKFDRCGDVKLYLVNSIVMYDGKPAKVSEARELGNNEFSIRLTYLSNDKRFTVRTDDDLLELDPPKLGYINAGGNAVYLHRDPVRHYKRGLSRENVRNKYFSNASVSDIARDDYPSYAVSIDVVGRGMVKSCAFSNNFAICTEFLYFKKRKVGRVLGTMGVVLDDKFMFLSNKLKESIDENS